MYTQPHTAPRQLHFAVADINNEGLAADSSHFHGHIAPKQEKCPGFELCNQNDQNSKWEGRKARKTHSRAGQ